MMQDGLGVRGVEDAGALSRRAAVLFFTHVWDASIEARFMKLSLELGGRYDIWVGGLIRDGDGFQVPGPAPRLLAREHDLLALGPVKSCVCREKPVDLRLHQLLPLYFFRQCPGYGHYWTIEFDVRYTGNWRDFFAELEESPADLLATNVQARHENPEWYHWKFLCTGRRGLAESSYVKAFLPVMRVSKRGFEAIDLAYRRRWHGHYEALWPTAIADAGMIVEDIGGLSSFAPQARRNRHYTSTMSDVGIAPGTFCYRPLKDEAEVVAEPAMLWHPVKPEALATW
jgi:hypothetical protein